MTRFNDILLVLGVICSLTHAVQASSQECICHVVQTHEMRVNEEGNRSERTRFDCLSASDSIPFKQIRLNFSVDDAIYLNNKEAFRNGEWFLAFPCYWVSNSKLPRHRNNSVHSLTDTEVKDRFNQPRRLRNGSIEKRIEGRRLSNIGKQQCAIVIVNGKDIPNYLTVADADNFLYTETSNQFKGCSNGALEFQKKDDTITVTLPNNLATYNHDNISDAINALVCDHYGLGSSCDITKERELDHVSAYAHVRDM